MITREDLDLFAIDLNDKGYTVVFGSLPDHKASRYDDREQLRLCIKRNPRKTLERYFSIDEYSEILDDIGELHDRIDEEYKLKYIKFEFADRSGVPQIESQTFQNNWIESLPTEDDLYDRINVVCSGVDKEVKKKFGEHVVHPTPNRDWKIIYLIDFTFKCRKYEKDQSDKRLRNLYNSLGEKDHDIKKKFRDIFKNELTFEGIKRFKEF